MRKLAAVVILGALGWFWWDTTKSIMEEEGWDGRPDY